MNNSKSITKNYLYNLIYQILIIIIPIITTPYVSRVLGADGVGKYSFSNSIVSYFVIFASLGFGYYAQREIAKYQGDKKKQSEIFWEIIIVRSVSVLTALVFYFTVMALGVFKEEYILLMMILSVSILAVAFDISFLFAGNEVFSKTVLTNTLLRILNVIAIFVFVKDRNDLWKYVLITALTLLTANASLSVYAKSFLCRIDIKSLKPIRHIKPAVILFLPTIAISVYTYLDKTMIGVITGSDFENGFYE
ncbi:MAG: oligosaccharide flippase family protein, partial [Acutalibacteraceae bacterium]|nr:oligosaccharide flippase family protein [Acutalibacteraceae bacterium]